jgi:phospholipid transport system transporter-binding protein
MIQRQGDVLVLNGALTIETVPAMVGAITEHLVQGAKQIDLSKVTEVDSSAIALLLEWQRQAASNRATLIWSGVPAALQNLANLYGIQELLPITT